MLKRCLSSLTGRGKSCVAGALSRLTEGTLLLFAAGDGGADSSVMKSIAKSAGSSYGEGSRSGDILVSKAAKGTILVGRSGGLFVSSFNANAQSSS